MGERRCLGTQREEGGETVAAGGRQKPHANGPIRGAVGYQSGQNRVGSIELAWDKSNTSLQVCRQALRPCDPATGAGSRKGKAVGSLEIPQDFFCTPYSTGNVTWEPRTEMSGSVITPRADTPKSKTSKQSHSSLTAIETVPTYPPPSEPLSN